MPRFMNRGMGGLLGGSLSLLCLDLLGLVLGARPQRPAAPQRALGSTSDPPAHVHTYVDVLPWRPGVWEDGVSRREVGWCVMLHRNLGGVGFPGLGTEGFRGHVVGPQQINPDFILTAAARQL